LPQAATSRSSASATAHKPEEEDNPVTVETVDGDEVDSKDEEMIILEKPPASKKTAPAPTATATSGAPATKKKAGIKSTYTRCAQIIKLVTIAVHQWHQFDQLKDKAIKGSIICPTLELQHRQWVPIKQVQAEVNDPKPDTPDTDGAPNAAATNPQYLVDRIANPLNDIKASLNTIMQKYNDTKPRSPSKTP
jgi:hypothetical protein